VASFKLTSLLLALLSFAIVAVILAVTSTATWTSDAFIPLIAAAMMAGLLIGAVHWLMADRYSVNHRRLMAHLDTLSDPTKTPSAPTLHYGLNEVANACQKVLEDSRTRCTTLTGAHRDLEIQLRIAQAQHHHLQTILNSMSDAVIVTDAFNEIALANQAAANVLGFDLESALHRPIDQVLTHPSLIKLIKDTHEGGQASLRRHVEQPIDHGHRQAIYNITLACVGAGETSIPGATGTSGVVTLLRDVTKEKEIAEMKSDFVSNVSHELRTPLSSIKAYMEMLIDGEADNEQTRNEFYNVIQSEANRLSRLIDNILNINRIESGIVKVQREQVALPSVIKEALDILQPQARGKNIELIEVPAPLYFQVFADRDMILQVALNLIGNAIKYTPEDGQITVSLHVDEHGQSATVTVSDTGLGIPEEDLPHVFDKFYRVNDHKKVAKGTGLGLNLVKHVIETVHGGQVAVTSQAGKGSTFTFALPMAENG